MKKALSVLLLTAMMLSLVPAGKMNVYAAEDTTDPVIARSDSGTDEGRHKEAGNVDVTASENPAVWQAVEVEASGGAPGKLDASATINGHVTLSNPDEQGCTYPIYGAYVHGGDGKATADIKEGVSVKNSKSSTATGVYVGSGGTGSATLTVGKGVSTTGPSGVIGVSASRDRSEPGGSTTVTVTGDVSATGGQDMVSGIQATQDDNAPSGAANVTVTGDVSATGKGIVSGILSCNADVDVAKGINTQGGSVTGVHVHGTKGMTVHVGQDITSTGQTARGVWLKTDPQNPDVNFEDEPGAASTSGEDSKKDVSVTIGGNVTATTNGTSGVSDYSTGVTLENRGQKSKIEVAGNVEVKDANGHAKGIDAIEKTDYYSYDDIVCAPSDRKSTILIHGDLISDGLGIAKKAIDTSYVDTEGDSSIYADGQLDVLVENTLDAKTIGIAITKDRAQFGDSDYAAEPGSESDSEPDINLNLTVWKINLNKDGHAAEWMSIHNGDSDANESSVKQAKNFEKHIMYITKVEQPGEGGTIKALDKDGNDLLTSYDFPIAHEGEKIILKADLKPGWKIKAVYNGLGSDKKKLSQDENDNYYLNVPKGGGIYLSADLEKEAAPSKTVSGTLIAKMTAKGSKGFTFGWTKVNGADGYDVFLASCNSKETKNSCKKVKTIKGNKTFKWTKKGLKKGKAYKAYVKAWIMKDGKKTYVKSSPLVHAYTNGGNKLFTNAKSVTVKKTKVTLAKDRTYKIKAAVSKLNPKKKLMPKGHAAKLRYLSSNTKIATVSKAGKIKAKAKGSCKIYVYAVNGISKTVTVRVK